MGYLVIADLIVSLERSVSRDVELSLIVRYERKSLVHISFMSDNIALDML
jgi:hypothetical protein